MVIMGLLIGALMGMIVTFMEMSDRPIHELAVYFGVIKLVIGFIVNVGVFGMDIGMVIVRSLISALVVYGMLWSIKNYFGLRIPIYLIGGLLVMIF